MMIKRKAVIFGIKGYKLSNKERIFLSKVKPWGIILFNRNIKNILQLKFLINDIKKIFTKLHYKYKGTMNLKNEKDSFKKGNLISVAFLAPSL